MALPSPAMVFPFYPFLSLSPELEALPTRERGAEGAEKALSCVHHLIGAFLSPCRSREAVSKTAPGRGFVMRRSCCNRSRTLGHLDVAGAKSSTEGMGSTHWEQGAGSGARKRDAHPSWLADPCTELPFYHKFWLVLWRYFNLLEYWWRFEQCCPALAVCALFSKCRNV